MQDVHQVFDDADAAVIAAALRKTFTAWRGDADGVRVVRAPGRVNLIGEHTDYNDGFVLPMTLDRAVYVAGRARPDARLGLRALNADEEVELHVGEWPTAAPDHWSVYVGGVLHAMQQRVGTLPGMDLLIAGNVPLGAGLSSSAALEVAVALAAETVAGVALDPMERARLCQHAEHTFAGVPCGIMDQAAACLGRAGHALLLDCRTLEYRHVPLPLDEVAVVVVDSGVQRALAGSKYEERRAECEEAVAILKRFDPTIRALRDVTPAQFEEHAGALPEVVRRRARHVVEENARVIAAVERLEAGNLEGLGALMNTSHASLRDLYAVSCAELDALADAAQHLDGVLGARMTGAGFGGCTVNLVRRDRVDTFCAAVPARYQAQCGRQAVVYRIEENAEAGVIPP